MGNSYKGCEFPKERNFWGSADVEGIRQWISDLQKIGYQFPPRFDRDSYDISKNETVRGHNCRKVSMEFVSSSRDSTEKSLEKLSALGDIAEWCAEANYTDVRQRMPSPSQLATLHTNSNVLRTLSDSVLIVTSNYPWNYTIGLIQRMYQPYFGLTIFCGTWFPDKYSEGYYVMADDSTFNFWHGINPFVVMHPSGDLYRNTGEWWKEPVGMEAALMANKLFTDIYKSDDTVQAIWHQFERGLKEKNPEVTNASRNLTTADGWTVSDMYYIPASGLDYHAGLMEVFFEAGLFHEIAIAKYLHSVPYVQLDDSRFDYLNGTGGRGAWHNNYNDKLVMMHPIKFSFFANLTQRRLFCDSVLMAFSRNLITVENSKHKSWLAANG
ncbi:hypothetical protein Y032_0106g3749 [Ancylostoma ceylanicum]|uniref:Uncharacterized protein n=1 Tax=Ancylostoma ceylanicum TaxID=53326 RepID=A0A016TG50_9BILA|nr:hypothetical protein Y032_0106g3749 [Ancylostoma ceylanicum]